MDKVDSSEDNTKDIAIQIGESLELWHIDFNSLWIFSGHILMDSFAIWKLDLSIFSFHLTKSQLYWMLFSEISISF